LHRVEDQLNSWLTALLPVPTTTPHVDQWLLPFVIIEYVYWLKVCKICIIISFTWIEANGLWWTNAQSAYWPFVKRQKWENGGGGVCQSECTWEKESVCWSSPPTAGPSVAHYYKFIR
jgi:hypothetical protein